MSERWTVSSVSVVVGTLKPSVNLSSRCQRSIQIFAQYLVGKWLPGSTVKAILQIWMYYVKLGKLLYANKWYICHVCQKDWDWMHSNTYRAWCVVREHWIAYGRYREALNRCEGSKLSLTIVPRSKPCPCASRILKQTLTSSRIPYLPLTHI